MIVFWFLVFFVIAFLFVFRGWVEVGVGGGKGLYFLDFNVKNVGVQNIPKSYQYTGLLSGVADGLSVTADFLAAIILRI